MMYHNDISGALEQQPFAFGDYLSATVRANRMASQKTDQFCSDTSLDCTGNDCLGKQATWSKSLTADNTKVKPVPLVIWLHPCAQRGAEQCSAARHVVVLSSVLAHTPVCFVLHVLLPLTPLVACYADSYNTGYSPQYRQANVRQAVAGSGVVVMAFDQVGFGIRVTQGGNKFYARHGGNASLLGQ